MELFPSYPLLLAPTGLLDLKKHSSLPFIRASPCIRDLRVSALNSIILIMKCKSVRNRASNSTFDDLHTYSSQCKFDKKVFLRFFWQNFTYC